jgi:hypothetical protein
MTVEFALRLASAAARALAPDGGTALVGKDTRLSGYMFEAALEAGFVAAGVNVQLIGPLPTPGIAYLTQRFGCNFGVVISASHNLYDDNGIKFFDGAGSKLSDELEERIEGFLDSPPVTRESRALGRAVRVDKSRTAYQEFCASTLTAGTDLAGLKIVIDCANGAAYKVAPRVLADLGAEIVPIGCSPNGRNINLGCGSTAPELLRMMVPGVGFDVGIALDGDGDRLVMVDHTGALVDGDRLLYVIARDRKELGSLKGPVVGTVMSNLGLERALADEGIPFLRAKVGDRYVLAIAQGARRRARRRNVGTPAVPRSHHHGRWARERAAGAGGDEAFRSQPRRAGGRHARVSAGHGQRPRARPGRPGQLAGDPRRRDPGRANARRQRACRAARVRHGARDPRHGRRARSRPGRPACQPARGCRPPGRLSGSPRELQSP